ncbi:MAG: hypothetical protein ABIE70_07920 [bacterium]
MNGELIVGIAGLVLLVVSNLITHRETKRRYERGGREVRIQRVFNKHQERFLPKQDGGISALLTSGVGLLENDGEVREVIRRLTVADGHSPLSGVDDKLADVDLLRFFCELAKGPPESAFGQLGG